MIKDFKTGDIILDYLDEPNAIQRILIRGRQEDQSEIDVTMEIRIGVI